MLIFTLKHVLVAPLHTGCKDIPSYLNISDGGQNNPTCSAGANMRIQDKVMASLVSNSLFVTLLMPHIHIQLWLNFKRHICTE